jgi:hypothetical protein
MKILIHSNDFDIINRVIQIAKDENSNVEIINGKVESTFLEHVNNNDVDGYIIQDNININKQVSFIRKSNMYIPIMIINDYKMTFDFSEEAIKSNVDFYYPYHSNYVGITVIFNMFLLYKKNFDVLLKLTEKTEDPIIFNTFRYEPNQRVIYIADKEIKKLSAKEGGVFEVLLRNYGKIVSKDIILEKVWHKSDYFAGRSMDVYVTHLRKLCKDLHLVMKIKNISGKGLIIE